MPGPTSTKTVAPSATMLRTLWVHFTGAVSWAMRFFLIVSGSVSAWGRDVLVHGTYRGVEIGLGNGACQFFAGRFHQWRVEGTAYRQAQGATGSGGFGSFAGGFYGRDLSRDDQLPGAVVVGGYDYTRGSLAESLLLFHPEVPVRPPSSKARLRRLSAWPWHVWIPSEVPSSKFMAPAATSAENSPRECPATISGWNPSPSALGQRNRVQENGRLGYFGLAQFFVAAGEHGLTQGKTEDLVPRGRTRLSRPPISGKGRPPFRRTGLPVPGIRMLSFF